MYEKILVPTDGSATADRGVQEAIRLAQALGSRIRLVHVLNEASIIGPYPLGATFDRMLEELHAHGASLLNTAEAKVRSAGVDVDSLMREAYGGEASELILRESAAWPASLIVCGTHGRRGLRRIVLGSDAEHILRESTVPVLLVRAR